MARDLPDVPQGTDPSVRRLLVRMRETLQELIGVRGDGSGAAITLEDARKRGIVDSAGRGLVGDVTIINNGGGGGGGGTYTPDLTPPPTVTGLTAAPGLTQIFLEWNPALYTAGNGHKQTNIYAVKKVAGDPAMPTFSEASLVYSATGALTVASLPSDLSTRWHIWAKWETNDGVESTSPAGGTNGVIAQTGKIGNVDLGPLIVEAQNMTDGAVIERTIAAKAVNYTQLADGAVRVQHLLVAPKSLIVDPSFSQGLVGWTNWRARFARSAPEVPAGCPVEFAAVFNGRDSFMTARIPVTAAEQYRVTGWVNRHASLPGTGFVAFGYDATGAIIQTTVVSVGAVTGWTRVTGDVTIAANVVALGVAPWNDQAHGGTIESWFADLQVEKKNDASLIVNGGILTQHLAAGSIAVGSAAIANGAILNAMIADATIDNAKIANVSVSKLTAGSLAVGQHITSTNYTAGSTGWIIQASGFAEFSNVVIRGATYTGTIYANAGTIGGITITAADIRSTDYVPGGAGFRLTSAGYLEASNVWLRGQITGGAITGWAWPAASSGPGFYLGGNGLLLGNYNDGQWVQIGSDGTMSVPGFSTSGGNAYFSGQLQAATGTFSGSMTAAAVNAVNTINLAGGAVTMLNSPSATGTGGTMSIPITVPAGNTYVVTAIGFQGTATNHAAGLNETSALTVGGASITLYSSITSQSGGANSTFRYGYAAASMGNVLTLPAGTHVVSMSGINGVQKLLVCLVNKR